MLIIFILPFTVSKCFPLSVASALALNYSTLHVSFASLDYWSSGHLRSSVHRRTSPQWWAVSRPCLLLSAALPRIPESLCWATLLWTTVLCLSKNRNIYLNSEEQLSKYHIWVPSNSKQFIHHTSPKQWYLFSLGRYSIGRHLDQSG